MAAAALGMSSSCGSDLSVTDTGSVASDGSQVGELTAYMVNYEDHSEIIHKLLSPSGTERQLLFAKETDLEPGTRLKVWATEEGDSLRVLRYEVLPQTVESQQRALVDAPAKTAKRWAVVMVDLGGGVNITKEELKAKIFDPMRPDSIRSYYREVSYGTQDLDGDVLGPFTIPVGNGCNTAGASALRAMATGNYTQYLWYFGSKQQCPWVGLAELGRADRPSRNSWYNASSSCVVMVQEPGHNFGMVHSSAVKCTLNGMPAVLPLPNEAGAVCQHSEYGNSYDPMGSGCFHMDGPQKAYQDWLSGCNVVKATSSGTFTLFPIEKACNGVQLLQIPLPAARTMKFGQLNAVITSYYLELRTPVGFDFKPNPMQTLTPRVLVTVGGDLRGAGQAGGRNWLLDMTPETNGRDQGLPVGKEYADADPMGPKFTVVSADNEKAVIQVTLPGGEGTAAEPGKGICDGNASMAFTAPGPATCNAAPATPASPPPDAGMPPTPPPAPTPTPPTPTPTPDAGAGGIDNPMPTPPIGTGGTGGSGSGGAGGEVKPPVGPIDAGCGCRTSPGQSGSGALLVVGLVAAALFARRRRR